MWVHGHRVPTVKPESRPSPPTRMSHVTCVCSLREAAYLPRGSPAPVPSPAPAAGMSGTQHPNAGAGAVTLCPPPLHGPEPAQSGGVGVGCLTAVASYCQPPPGYFQPQAGTGGGGLAWLNCCVSLCPLLQEPCPIPTPLAWGPSSPLCCPPWTRILRPILVCHRSPQPPRGPWLGPEQVLSGTRDPRSRSGS